MKKSIFLIFAISLQISCNNESTISETNVLRIHKNKFAFCGASGAIPTGKKIIIQGVEYEEGCAICPVLDGPSFSNLAMYGSGGTWGDFNVKNNFKTPDGTDNTIWSLFWYYDTNDSVPQFNPKSKKWEIMPSSNRSFIINTDSVSTSESNMFCMPGIVFDTTSTGIILARCYGPLNEAAVPLRKALPLKTGMISITAAKKGVPYPVGTAFPVKE